MRRQEETSAGRRSPLRYPRLDRVWWCQAFGGVAGMSRGQLVILVILGLALGAATFGLWWRHGQTRRALEFWGPAAAGLIARAERVEALRIERVGKPGGSFGGDAGDFLQVDSQNYAILATQEVSGAPGFLNARHALTLDPSFDWGADPAGCQPQWEHAIRFSSPAGQVTILVDFHCQRLRQAAVARTVGMGPIAAGLQAVLTEQLAGTSEGADDPDRDD